MQVVVVSFEREAVLPRLTEGFPEVWRFVSDPERVLYSEYGAGEASLPSLISPRTLWVYLRALLRGRFPRNRSRGDGQRADAAQLGGDFVISREGQLVLAWRSRTPADRPGMETLSRALGG